MHFFGNTKLFCHFLLADIEKVLYDILFFVCMSDYIIRCTEYLKHYFYRLFKAKNRSFSNRMETDSARKPVRDDSEKKLLKPIATHSA